MTFLKIFSSEWLTKLVGTTEFNAKTKTKWQRKYLPSNLTSANSNISTLSFNNLTIGKTYRVKASAKMVGTTGGTCALYGYNGATQLLNIVVDADSTSTTLQIFGISDHVEFIATATTFRFEFALTGTATLFGSGNEVYSWTQIEELPNHEATTTWT